MSGDPENFTQHFKDSWDQTVGAWASIFKGVRGATKVVAKGTKETVSSAYEDSKVEAVVNISKDIVKTTAYGSTAAVGLLVDKTKEVAGLGGKHDRDHRPETGNRGAPSFISSAQQKVLVGIVVGVLVLQTGYIVYLYKRAQKIDRPAPKWQKPDNLRTRSPQPSPPLPQPLGVIVIDDVPLADEEEDRRLAASEARYRKDMDMESLGSD
jgi:hypothetical protein